MRLLHLDQDCRRAQPAHGLLGRRLTGQLNTLRSRTDALKASISANQTAIAALGDPVARPATFTVDAASTPPPASERGHPIQRGEYVHGAEADSAR